MNLKTVSISSCNSYFNFKCCLNLNYFFFAKKRDVAHKILRSQTCWHLMSDISTQCGRSMERFREEVFNQLIGTVVLTRYNNRTYRIDDIMWDENPLTTFNYHTGQITYYDYYK